MRNVTRSSERTSGETTGAGVVCAKALRAHPKAKIAAVDKSIRLIALPVYGGKMVTDVRYDLA
jgi:hypothetical protein